MKPPALSSSDPPERLQRCRLGDQEIAYTEAGPAEGELVILLHGFPEYRAAWHAQIAGLARAGFRVVVPDQRGYGESGKPAGLAAYDLDLLAADITGLARHLGHPRFNLVGHDWGAAVGWWLASREPAALLRLVALNAPHPSVWREAMNGDWRQWLKSLYVRILWIPALPEFLLRRRDYRALADALAPAPLGAAQLAGYRAAWAQPGALTGMINWYRAFLAKSLPAASSISIDVPILVIWGDRDPYGLPELAERSADLCRRARIVHVPDASHWVHHEQPEYIGTLLAEFLAAPAGT